MTLYRNQVPVAIGSEIIPTGTLGRWTKLAPKGLARLVARHTLVEVAPPPLAVLPGWEHRSRRLAEIGVKDAEQVLVANVDELAQHMGVGPALVRRWQADLETWLATPPSQHS